MHYRERGEKILEALSKKTFLTVKDLTTLLDVSEATIRRDLTRLAGEDRIRRLSGGAELLSDSSGGQEVNRFFQDNLPLNQEKKRAVAQKAASLCKEDDSIFIDGGTTTYMMLPFLPQENLQILTNSFPIAQELVRSSHNRIILPGGEIFREQSVVLSAFENDGIQSYSATKLFMGAHGVGEQGLTQWDSLLIRSEEKLLKYSEQLIVMVDSSKFSRKGRFILCPLSRINTLITDDDVEDKVVKMLETAGVEVIIAEAQ